MTGRGLVVCEMAGTVPIPANSSTSHWTATGRLVVEAARIGGGSR